MAKITFKGNPIETVGTLPAKGTVAPDFKLVAGDLSEASLATFAGKKKILNIVPSLDTGICQISARTFNAAVGGLPGVALINVSADLPAKGTAAPDFKLVAGDLSEATLATFAGKKKILNIVPSLDTGICQISARTFNAAVGELPGVALINVSADLPFAQKRFCEAEKLTHIANLSTFRSPQFGQAYGVTIATGPLAGLLSRAVVVLDENNQVLHTQQVPEIAQEPDYAAALAAVK